LEQCGLPGIQFLRQVALLRRLTSGAELVFPFLSNGPFTVANVWVAAVRMIYKGIMKYSLALFLLLMATLCGCVSDSGHTAKNHASEGHTFRDSALNDRSKWADEVR
jgi:hypothetical protein